MSKGFSFINDVAHRPWPMPSKNWQFYQEWNDVLFLHFEVAYNDLRPLIPDSIILDSFNDKYYISVVAFKMEHIRPAYLPAVNFISNFHEINVRTYVKKNNKTGVYFINIEAAKVLSAFIAKSLSGLPYEKADIIRDKNAYINLNKQNNCYLDVTFDVEEKINHKTDLEKWLTERYSLFLIKNKKLHIYEIHHKEWDIYQVNIKRLDIDYQFNDLTIAAYQLIGCQYSPGVQVISWSSDIIE